MCSGIPLIRKQIDDTSINRISLAWDYSSTFTMTRVAPFSSQAAWKFLASNPSLDALYNNTHSWAGVPHLHGDSVREKGRTNYIRLCKNLDTHHSLICIWKSPRSASNADPMNASVQPLRGRDNFSDGERPLPCTAACRYLEKKHT